MNWRDLVNRVLVAILRPKPPTKPTFGYREAEELHRRIGPELYGEDGHRWPTMIGCGVGADETTGEPVVVVSFLKGTEPKEGFPNQVQGVKIRMRLSKSLPRG